MDFSTLVNVIPSYIVVLDGFDGSRLAWFLVILDLVADLKVKSSWFYHFQLRKEFRLKDTIQKWIGFLRATC